MLTSDSEPAIKTVKEPLTEVVFVPEPRPHRESDQVHDLAPTSVKEGILVAYDDMGWSPAHTPAVEGELCQVPIILIDGLENIIP